MQQEDRKNENRCGKPTLNAGEGAGCFCEEPERDFPKEHIRRTAHGKPRMF